MTAIRPAWRFAVPLPKALRDTVSLVQAIADLHPDLVGHPAGEAARTILLPRFARNLEAHTGAITGTEWNYAGPLDSLDFLPLLLAVHHGAVAAADLTAAGLDRFLGETAGSDQRPSFRGACAAALYLATPAPPAAVFDASAQLAPWWEFLRALLLHPRIPLEQARTLVTDLPAPWRSPDRPALAAEWVGLRPDLLADPVIGGHVVALEATARADWPRITASLVAHGPLAGIEARLTRLETLDSPACLGAVVELLETMAVAAHAGDLARVTRLPMTLVRACLASDDPEVRQAGVRVLAFVAADDAGAAREPTERNARSTPDARRPR